MRDMLLVVSIIVLSGSVHEFAHAWVAHLGGDDTARELGRMTVNPLAHIDLFWTIILPAMLALMKLAPVGAGKPVPVNPMLLTRWWYAASIAAGPLSNLLIALVTAAVWRLVLVPIGVTPRVGHLCWLIVVINIGFCVFNLLPIYPLDGSRVFAVLFLKRTSLVSEGPHAFVVGLLVLSVVMSTRILGRTIDFLVDLVLRMMGLP